MEGQVTFPLQLPGVTPAKITWLWKDKLYYPSFHQLTQGQVLHIPPIPDGQFKTCQGGSHSGVAP